MNTKPENILFLDIETVPAYPDYRSMPENWQKLWDKKAALLAKNEETSEQMYERAGIYAEFGKIICISVGYILQREGVRELRVTSFWGDDEREILQKFAHLLVSNFNKDYHQLCAHNGKEFDIPYLCRRMLIHSIIIPPTLDVSGKKPWETKHIDTMQFWKFNDFKNFTSLELMAALFDIPTPKDDIDGSEVYGVYYIDVNPERIKTYCEKDVVTLVNVYLRLHNLPIFQPEQVVHK